MFKQVILHKNHKRYEEEDTNRDVDAISKGILIRHKYGGYLTRPGTIINAQATDPLDFDNPNYNVEKVWAILNRYAEKLYVANDDLLADLFIIVSHHGVMAFSPEMRVPATQAIELFHVYEVRLRSPLQGLKYRLSEQPLRPLA